MFDTILVPTDGSEGMARVIETASELADVHDSTVHFVYAVHTASFASLPMESSWEGVGVMLREEGDKALEAAKRQCTADRIETAIVDGPPSREILAYAEETGCDLIVMGTHGRGGLNRLLLGSVAERVVRSATIPVMTVRVGETEGRPSGVVDEQPITADPSVTEALE
ncbi:MAG: universal stress protein [Halobacteriota archaeon]|uniref:universal stress protein n=1 Tax=Natronomonas sp. TaxID=2184060 RepID=UPI003976F515